MYDLIDGILDHNWVTGSSDQQYIYYIAGAIIVILTVVFIDLGYRVFSHFWNGGK
jgi:hypothetical protein